MKSQKPDSESGHLLFVVNSVFGGRNTPGFRPYQLIRFGHLFPTVFARGSAVSYSFLHFPLPGRALFPRALNLIRVKFWPSLPARQIEQQCFDVLCLFASRRLKWRPRAVHLWDSLPETASFWHGQGVPLLLDLQMAHPRCYAPLIASGAVDPKPLGMLTDVATDRCLPLIDRIVCPSEFVQNSLPSSAKSVVIPFGADQVAVLPHFQKNLSKEVPLRVLFAGNVNLRKGVPFLLEAWEQLSPELLKSAELVLCGRVFKEMTQLLANSSARCVGFQADMVPWFGSADLFVLPSLMEGSAKSVYEAMAYGLPVIVSSHTGSIVRDGIDGLVVPPADSTALVSALSRALSDAGLRRQLGETAKLRVSSYSWETYAEKIRDLYQKFPTAEYRRFADTYREHQQPRPLLWKLNQAKERLLVFRKSLGRKIGGTQSSWLRFPFYHHVFSDERKGFSRHLNTMKKYGEFISLDQAVKLLEKKLPIDGKYFCLTFDDGFRNVLTNALPILTEQQVPSAVFLISNLVLENSWSWNEQHDAFFKVRKPATMLTWEDCRILATAGVTLGSHTANHRKLIELSGEEVKNELKDSKDQIEKAIGRPCEHFCCPWGKPTRDFRTERDPELARQLGYRSFLTTHWGVVKTGDSPFSVRRVGIVAKYGLAQLRYFLSLS
ncbi:hypothetical protein CCP3SC1AL1_480008 [Gammaproteobacteria bacterium]